MDVIEIDGRSNRGVDEIRNLPIPSAYATGATETIKIYIIDECTCLTKERSMRF